MISVFHASIDFQIICPKSSPSSDSCSYFHDFRHADYSAIIQYISDIDWLLLFNMCSTVDDVWSTIEGVLRESIARFVPLRKV